MKSFFLGLGFVLATALVTGCTSREDDGSLQVLHISQGDDVKTLDPANAYDSISLEIAPSIYETLYQYDYLNETYKVVPLLAADMPKYSADRLTVTIPLKHGVKFQDDAAFKDTHGKGRELKAQDFVYAFKRLGLPSLQSQGWWIFDGKIKGMTEWHDKMANAASKAEIPALFDAPIDGLKAVDDYTLQLKLTKPYPQLLYILSMTFTAPVAKEAVTAYADERGNLTEHAVGTGPYLLKTWDRGRKLVLERNPNFHVEFYPDRGATEFRQKGMLADSGKPLPFLDRISVNVLKEQQPMWLKFMKGELDIAGIPKDNFAGAISNQVNLSPELAAKGMRLSIEIGTIFYYISFNVKDKLVSNKLLRQAISSAIDRDKWIEIFTNGRGRKMVTALPPGIPDRPENSKIKYDYDIERAKELLKKAGYPNGEGLATIKFDMRGADSVNRQMGEFFTSQLAKIGIKLDVIYNTFPAYLEKMKQGALQMSYGGWSMDYPDAENVYQLLYGPNKSPGPNDSNFDHPEMNKAYEQMAVMESGPRRAAVVKHADDVLQEEVPWALGYYSAVYTLSQPWLLNFRANDIMQNKFKYYRINRDAKKRYQEQK